MFLADQQAGIPSGNLVTDQSDGATDVGARMIGRVREMGAIPSPFRRQQKGSGCD